MTRIDVRDLIGGAVETIRPAAEAKGLRLTLSIDDGIADITGDPARLRQVLWNVLSNAVKFTPAGGDVELRATYGPTDIEIIVRDTGPGISPDFLPHVFEPFRQGDSSSTRMVGGLGLGLAIVRHIVEAHGGTATAQSDGPGLGTTLSVRLPGGCPHQEPDTNAGTGTLRGRRVLAVDDDESTQELVATMLLMYGVSVRTAGRAAQALQILCEWRPDVLLTDIAMPGEDGYALMRKVRALGGNRARIAAVALTAHARVEDRKKAFDAGFEWHLAKPIDPGELVSVIVTLVPKNAPPASRRRVG
jgi:CheY-like chemotaxis protein